MAQSSDADFERCCRLCAEEQDVTIMIFSKEAEALLLQNKLNKYLLIEVSFLHLLLRPSVLTEIKPSRLLDIDCLYKITWKSPYMCH